MFSLGQVCIYTTLMAVDFFKNFGFGEPHIRAGGFILGEEMLDAIFVIPVLPHMNCDILEHHLKSEYFNVLLNALFIVITYD